MPVCPKCKRLVPEGTAVSTCCGRSCTPVGSTTPAPYCFGCNNQVLTRLTWVMVDGRRLLFHQKCAEALAVPAAAAGRLATIPGQGLTHSGLTLCPICSGTGVYPFGRHRERDYVCWLCRARRGGRSGHVTARLRARGIAFLNKRGLVVAAR